MNTFRVRLGLGLTASCLLAACSSEPLTDDEDNVATLRSAVTTSAEYRDASGKLRMTIKTCDWVGTTSGASPTKQNQATCTVDAGWRMVGGGAEIENEPTNGAYLLASAPDTGGGRSETDWAARSKGPAAHRLRAYVIQLKIDGSDPADPFDFVVQTDNEGPPSATPSYEDPLGFFSQSDYIFLGGGASLMPPTLAPNGALTRIRPYDAGTEWRLDVRGKMFSGTGTIKAYTFGLKRCPSYLNGACIEQERRYAQGSTNSGYATVTNTVRWPAAMLGIGGIAHSKGSGKFLTDLIPFNGGVPGVTVRTYRNGGTDDGAAGSYLMNFWVHGSPQSYNIVNFIVAGALYRSGTTLQQFGSPNSAQHKWHLEYIPGSTGLYLLRNGNPGYGGDCAYRSGTSVKVGTTCSGAAYQWQGFWRPITDGAFSLQNVQSGTCMDTNGNGYDSTTARDVVLKTCDSTGAWQGFFQNSYDNWPPPQ